LPLRRVGEIVEMRAAWIVTLGIVGALACGCVVNEPESPTRGVVVSGPPPALVREEPSPPPNPQAFWVNGYWHWTGMQYAWIPGHWEAPPAGAVWAAPRITSLQDGRYVYESGGWRRPASSNAVR
jgi:hypothetical protein